jgi:Restriction endonuclease
LTNNGKQLEALVAFVEERLLPQGFEVKTNEKVFNDDGVQVAEFDVEIRGKVGSTEIAWLIECRDRPSSGAAPSSWIEQLVGRRTRFGFNKVTAVSTTGFADGAKDFAEAQGIELRDVKSLSSEEFSDWLLVKFISQHGKLAHLLDAKLFISDSESVEIEGAMNKVLINCDGNSDILSSNSSSAKTSLKNAFLAFVDANEMFKDVESNATPKQVNLMVTYTNDMDHFTIETELGAVRIESIQFVGELSVKEWKIPLYGSAEYRHTNSGEVISQTASYKMESMEGVNYSLELHKISETGEVSILLRNIDVDKN